MDVVKKKTEHPERFEVYLIALDPTVGAVIQKTRPCVVISPDEMNRHLRTVMIAPMTSTLRAYPSRVPVVFKGKKGSIALDQIRTVDRDRLVTCWGSIASETANHLCHTLTEMFSL
jgi:mRNA interferase MazF